MKILCRLFGHKMIIRTQTVFTRSQRSGDAIASQTLERDECKWCGCLFSGWRPLNYPTLIMGGTMSAEMWEELDRAERLVIRESVRLA